MHKYLVTQLPDYENYNILKIMLHFNSCVKLLVTALQLLNITEKATVK